MDCEDILERYKRYRAVTFEINNHTLPELLSKETFETAARRIGMWVRGKVVLDHVDQTAILMDYAIHDCRVAGRNAVERYVAQHPPPAGSERDNILTAMQRAFYSLFQVESVVPGVGVHVLDLFRDQRHFLADVGFSQTSAKGMVLATRVFPFADFLMTGGAALAADANTLERIGRLSELPRPHKEIVNLAPEVRAELNAAIIRLCLSTKNVAQVFYQGVDEDEGEEPEVKLPTRRIGRNDPCPCGSGKKYKKCCGR